MPERLQRMRSPIGENATRGASRLNPPVNIPAIAPGREIRRCVRRQFSNGRVIEFVYRLETHATPEMTFQTWELEDCPGLDCSCTPLDADDVVCCSLCGTLACVRRHAASCFSCGRVFCSACLHGAVVQQQFALLCEACRDRLLLSWLARLWKRLVRRFLGRQRQ